MLDAVDGLLVVGEETVDVAQFAVCRGPGFGLQQVVRQDQPLLEADLHQETSLAVIKEYRVFHAPYPYQLFGQGLIDIGDPLSRHPLLLKKVFNFQF